MHAVLVFVRVVIVVQAPALEVGALNHQGVTFPMPHWIAEIRRLDSGAMRTPVQRNDPGHALEFMHDHQVVLVLHELHGIGRQHSRWEAGRHTKLAGLVMPWIAGGWFKERHAARLEWSKFAVIENSGGAFAAIAAIRFRP